MTSILNSVIEIIPDCDLRYLHKKVSSTLQTLGILNVGQTLETLRLDESVISEMTRMILDDIFTNGYTVKGSEQAPLLLDDDDEDDEVRVGKRHMVASSAKIDDKISSSKCDSSVVLLDEEIGGMASGTSAPVNFNRFEADDWDQPGTSAISHKQSPRTGKVTSPTKFQCMCCFCDTTFDSMASCCEGIHFYCNDCLKDYVKTKTQDGVKQGYLECMENDCSAPFARSMLALRIPQDMLAKLDESIASRTVQAAIEDLVRCPKCQTQFELPANEQVLACFSCKFNSCRHCKVEWTAEHSGKKCEELESNDATKARRDLEEKMTEAMIRRCPKCKSPIIKNQGCNKLCCSCGGKLCYVCRTPNVDYDHFCNHAVVPGQIGCKQCNLKCRLWYDPTVEDEREVKEMEAQTKFIAERDRLQKLIDLGKADGKAMDKLLADRKAEEEMFKKEKEKPGPMRNLMDILPGVNLNMPIQRLPQPANAEALADARRRLLQAQLFHRQAEQNRQRIEQERQQQLEKAKRIHGDLFREAEIIQQRVDYEKQKRQRDMEAAAKRSLLDSATAGEFSTEDLDPVRRRNSLMVKTKRAKQDDSRKREGFAPGTFPTEEVERPRKHEEEARARDHTANAASNIHRQKVRSDETHHPVDMYNASQNNNVGLATPRLFPKPVHSLLEAVEAGAVNTIRDVVAAHGQFVLKDVKDEDGESLLHLAVNSGKLPTVACLVSLGVKVWCVNQQRNSPLHNAAGLGHHDIAKFLIDRGAGLGVPGEYGRTPLHAACANGHVEIVRLLIGRGADVNAKDNQHGATPLHLAANFGYSEIVQLLLEYRADFNAVDNKGNTAIDAAMASENTHLIELFFAAKENKSRYEDVQNNRKRNTPVNEPQSSKRFKSDL